MYKYIPGTNPTPAHAPASPDLCSHNGFHSALRAAERSTCGQWPVGWPLQDIILLQSFIVGVNHPFIAPSTCRAYPIAILLHDYCATYPLPTDHPFYAIHHTILVMALSCKSQRTTRWPVASGLAFTRYCLKVLCVPK